MKTLIWLFVFLLSACATQDTYNNQQVKTQCAIGYHQEYSTYKVLYDSENKEEQDNKKSKMATKYRCMPDSENDKLLHPENY